MFAKKGSPKEDWPRRVCEKGLAAGNGDAEESICAAADWLGAQRPGFLSEVSETALDLIDECLWLLESSEMAAFFQNFEVNQVREALLCPAF